MSDQPNGPIVIDDAFEAEARDAVKGSPGWHNQQDALRLATVDGTNIQPKKAWRAEKTHQTHQAHRKPGAPDIRLVTGERARATDEALVILRARGDIYERSGELVRVADKRLESVSDDWLLDAFDRSVNFIAARNGSEYLKDAPQWLAKRINAKKGERGLPELRAVITAPTMRKDGSLLDKPGYDKATGLLLTPGEWPTVPANPTIPEMKAAAANLWKPFAEFPFVDDAACGVHVATILTAMIRQTLPLAPGTSYDAPGRRHGQDATRAMRGGAVRHGRRRHPRVPRRGGVAQAAPVGAPVRQAGAAARQHPRAVRVIRPRGHAYIRDLHRSRPWRLAHAEPAGVGAGAHFRQQLPTGR